MESVNFSRDTEILHRGSDIKGKAECPEAAPIYLTTAFTAEDLEAVEALYTTNAYTYIRTRNPNRDALAELVTYLEGGEASMICGSGMAAISTLMMSILDKGDHILSDQTLYGETIELFSREFSRYGIEVSYVDFTDTAKVKEAVRPNTKVLYTEVISNPMITVVDVEAVARLAHHSEALLVVDNTFTTSAAVKPLELGADISINSLTKFANGHSDAVAGSVTGPAKIIQRAYELQMVLGTAVDPFTAWICQRGMRTMDLRVQRQMANATELAAALEANRHVVKVHHPSLPGHPQHQVAKRILKGFGAMLSFEMPDDRARINEFMRRLNIAHYAMTLGGYRTTLSHPVTSSHRHFPEPDLRQIGITPGLMRVSVGVEDAGDLIRDFTQALEAFA